jgi:Zn-dependent M28 family amino/carboxypeptidase
MKMSHLSKLLAVFAASVSTISCSQQTPEADAERIYADMYYLADDLLEGRETGEPGHELAALFVENRFHSLGLTKLPDEDSFFQPVQLASSNLGAPGTMAIMGDGNATELELAANFFVVPSLNRDEDSVEGQVVFVGHGASAPGRGVDDFAGIDLEGKIIAFVRGRIEALSPDESAYFSNPFALVEYARSQGAIGAVNLVTEKELTHFPFEAIGGFVQNRMGVAIDGASGSDDFVFGIMHPEAAALLFEGSENNFEDTLAKLANGEYASADLNVSLSMTRSSTRELISSPNMVGVIEGSDPVLKHEYVMFSAHLDHLGISPMGEDDTEDTDRINNGFYDNASGSAIVLEVARMVSQSGIRPRRSIIVALMTGEEKGLLGSSYFAQTSPLMPSIVADLNIDKILFTEPSTGIMPLGGAHSTIDAFAANLAPEYGLTMLPDPYPNEGYFARSDHFSYVLAGVPSISLFTIFTQDDLDPEGDGLYPPFNEANYHQPSDDNTQEFHRESAARFTNYSYGFLMGMANADERPSFLEGDTFGELFGR